MTKRSRDCNYEVTEFIGDVGADAVFCWFHTKDKVLTFNRWDGMVGTAGGKVDSGENPVEALIRELWEEINVDSERFYFKPLLAVRNKDTGFKIQSWICEVSELEMKTIMEDAKQASHFDYECNGLTLDKIDTLSVPNLLDRPFVASAEMEYREVLKRIGVKEFVKEEM